MLTEVRLYGDLVDFGAEWNLDIHTPMEALQAIDANRPGFLGKLESEGKYAFILTKHGEGLADEDSVLEPLDLERLKLPISHKQTLHIIPVPEGDDGVVFAMIAIIGDYLGGTTLAYLAASVIVAVAIVVILVGVSMLLMPAPPGMDETEENPSYYFGGPVNTSRQGACVPVLYGGPLLVGSQVIGQSLIAEDVDDGNATSLKSTAYAEIVDAISEGPIEGFAGADLESSVYLDSTPFKADGVDLFEGFDVVYTVGTQDQDVQDLNLSSNPSVSSVNSVGVVIRNSTGGLIHTTTDPNVGRIKITVNTGRFMYMEDDGDIIAVGVALKVSLKGSGEPSFVPVKDILLQGVATSSYYKTVSFPVSLVGGSAPYTIKVERVTPDHDSDPKASTEVYWSSWTEEILSNCSYPFTAFARTKFDAEKFSALPVRGFLMKGLLIDIPDNYNPITRAYDNGWGGVFDPTRQWTNNPAWVYHDLATNPRYGLGKYLEAPLIDKWALYAIAQYCDEMVDDGYGGQEPRFACNLYLQTKGEAFSVLKELASAFRSIQFWTGGQLRVHQDSPAAVSSLFAPANVVGGNFNYSGSPKHKRFTVALVTWINPEDNYSSWVEYVEDEAGIQLYGVNETSITAVGCTSRGQAHRAGKYALLVSRLETDVVGFKTGMDAGTAIPGKIIRVVDPLHNQSDEDVGGRVKTITNTTTIVLDRPVTLVAGHTYHITLVLPDGTSSAHQINNGAGTVTPPSPITFATPLAQTPVDGAMWAISDDAESQRLYRVLSLVEAKGTSPEVYEVTGVRYDADVLSQADDPGQLEPPDVPPINPGLSSPSALRLEEGVLPVGTTFRRYIDATWVAPDVGVVDRYKIEIIDPSGTETSFYIRATDYRIYDVVEGIYTITVRAVNVAGQISAGVSATITISALLPIDLIEITGLELIGQGNDTEFTGKDAEFTWRLTSTLTGDLGDETYGGDTGIDDPWFRDYEIIMYDTGGNILRVEHTTNRSYIYTFEKNVEDGGPNRTFEIGVAARDIYNRTSDEMLLEVTNPPPVGYTNISIRYGIELIVITFGPPADPDFVGTRVYVSQLQYFTPDPDTNLAYEGPDLTVTISDLPEEQYYVVLEGVDAFGPAEIYTQEIGVLILSVSRIHDQIAGEIQEGWLYQSLNDRIDLIDTTPNINLLERVGINEAAIQTLQTSEFIGLYTYYQDTDPQLGVPNPGDDIPTLLVGDLWINTSSGDAISRWNGTVWDNLASGGSTVYYGDGDPDNPFTGQPPDPDTLVVGDYWVDIHDYGDGPANIPWMWNGTDWVDVSHGLIYAHAGQITAIEAVIDDPTAGSTAMALFLNDVDVRVESNADGTTANASNISLLTVEVNTKVSTYYQLSTNPPASPVDGDLWFHTDDNNHPFRYNVSLDQWIDVRDSSATGATTWIAAGPPDPSDPKYTVGDLYFDSDNLNMPYRFTGTIWENIQDGSSTGLVTYYQDEEPLPIDDPPPKVGDLWFDSDADNKIHRYGGSLAGWVPVTDGTAIGVIPYIQPNEPQPPLVVGDIWIDTDYNDHPYEWDGFAWVSLAGSNRTITASTAVERYARVEADGLAFAEYSIKVDVNGHIAGIGLGVSGGASGPIRSSIVMLADQFALGFPTAPFENDYFYDFNIWVTPTQAWIDVNGEDYLHPDGEWVKVWEKVYRVTNDGISQLSGEPNWPTVDNVTVSSGSCVFKTYPKSASLPFVTGEVVTNLGEIMDDPDIPPITEHGIIIKDIMIGQASISSAHILDLTVTSAKIKSLTADKIDAGVINITDGGYIYVGGPNFSLQTTTKRMTINDGTRDRVEIGGISTGGYGIIIRDAANNIMLQSGGLSEIDGTYIKNATISSAKIENELVSSNWQGPGSAGFELRVNSDTGAGSATFNEISIYNGDGDLILHSGSSLGDFSKAGSGVNIVPGDYANFQNPATVFAPVQCTTVLDETDSYFAGSCLRITATLNQNCYFTLSPGRLPEYTNIKLTPGKKWIISFWCKMNVPKMIAPYFHNGSQDFSGGNMTPTAANQWERLSTTIDMTALTSVTDVMMHFYFWTNAIGQYVMMDGLMVEEQVGSGTYPSAYYAGEVPNQAAGANMVFNSQMFPHNSGWWYSETQVGDPANWDVSSRADGWSIYPGVLQVYQGSTNLTGYAFVGCPLIPIDGTKRYQVGGLTGAHRCTVRVGVVFSDINRAYVSPTVYCPDDNVAEKSGGDSLEGGKTGSTGNGYFTHQMFLEPSQIPAEAAYVQVIFLKNPTHLGADPPNSYMFATHAFFAEVSPTQTEFAPYTIGYEAISAMNPVSSANVTTYIKDASIDSAQIANLAVETAHIQNLSVDYFKVQGGAITLTNNRSVGVQVWGNAVQETVIDFTFDTTYMLSVIIGIGLSGICPSTGSRGTFWLVRVDDGKTISGYLPGFGSTTGDTVPEQSFLWTAFCYDVAPLVGPTTYRLMVNIADDLIIQSATLYSLGAKR